MHIQIIVEYNNIKYNLEVDTNDTVDVLKQQIFSLTSIEPKQQKLIGLTKNNNNSIFENEKLSNFLIESGQIIQMVKINSSTQLTKSKQLDRKILKQRDIDQQCSRIYFADLKFNQPSAICENRKICFACSKTCRSMQKVEPCLNSEPFECQCHLIETSIQNSEGCIFQLRFGAELLVEEAEKQSLLKEAKYQFNRELSLLQDSSKRRMVNQLSSYVQSMKNYENKSQQAEALKIIPLDLLEKRAKDELGITESEPQNKQIKMEFRDELLRQLLKQFKHEFFQQVNSPKCLDCNTDNSSSIGYLQPTTEELSFGAGTVEGYQCNKCQRQLRFPRYNNPAKLMKTHCGRCGEQAQAFMLCCRALKFDSRMVHDYTDHVWIEIQSVALNRWVHTDCCENVFDSPLLYESGQNKKLTYCIATSVEQIVDVTKRYTRKQSEVSRRRNLCDEDWLQSEIRYMDENLKQGLSLKRIQELDQRLKNEFKELEDSHNNERSLNSSELQGRTTGSYEQRKMRNELGKSIKAEDIVNLSRLYGSKHDDSIIFDDIHLDPHLKEIINSKSSINRLNLSAIKVWHLDFVYAFKLIYEIDGKSYECKTHGCSENKLPSNIINSEIKLQKGEKIVEIGGSAGALLDYLNIKTNHSEYNFGSSKGGEKFEIEVPSNSKFCGFYGLYGGHIHSIGICSAEINQESKNEIQQLTKIRQELSELVRKYFKQFTKGCGQKSCKNFQCATGKGTIIETDHKSRIKLAIKLASEDSILSKLCKNIVGT